MSEAWPELLLVGCGKMGGALLQGWLERGLTRCWVVDPQAAATDRFAERVMVVREAQALPASAAPQVVLFAIKPQEAPIVLPAYARFTRPDTLFISIMAGRSIAAIRAALGGEARIVRAMPNTPAAVGRGFTAAYAAPEVSGEQRALAEALLGAVGEVAWLTAEDQLNPVTAISGGGPAYVFLLVELLEHAARDQGLAADLARRMARATVAGAGALLAASEEDAATLRRAVTSPKGTTERALAVLMAADAWPALIARAIQAATDRARELVD